MKKYGLLFLLFALSVLGFLPIAGCVSYKTVMTNKTASDSTSDRAESHCFCKSIIQNRFFIRSLVLCCCNQFGRSSDTKQPGSSGEYTVSHHVLISFGNAFVFGSGAAGVKTVCRRTDFGQACSKSAEYSLSDL